MQENEIKDEIAWWENKEFIKELDQEYVDWQCGKTEGYTLEEANTAIEELRAKRAGKRL